MIRTLGAALAAVALCAAPVEAHCWNGEEASAATVRQLQSMLMVATLRCHAAGYDIAGDYNVFLSANKAALGKINERLKAHFIKAAGPVAGQRAYDGYTTSMANGYGAGGSSAEACATTAALEREAGLMAGSVEGLVMIAEREALVVTMPDGRCEAPVTMAAAATTRGIVAAVQPAPTPLIADKVGTAPPVLRAVAAPSAVAVAAVDPALSFIPAH